ncbi:MAG: CHAD domain-containing protein [Myxococcota bacterium]
MSESTFLQGEPIADGFVRLYEGLLDDAIAHLSGRGHPEEIEAVHEARKALKKARALLRLVRDDLPQYRRANRLCRDAGREISELRDASAQIETLDMARRRFPEGVVDDALDRIRAELVARRDAMHADGAPERIASALELARKARAVSADFDVRHLDVHTLQPGLALSYGRGLLVFHRVLRGYDTDLLHQWRKRAKYHRYHVGFIQEAWPSVLKAREKTLHELTELLGDDHDLSVLHETLGHVVVSQPSLAIDAAAVVEIATGVRAELQAAALRDGALCFAEAADAMAVRLTAYVRAWQRA